MCSLKADFECYANKMNDNIKTTQTNLEKELIYAKMYLKILDEWCNPLLKSYNSFRENSPKLLEVLRESVMSSLISSMSNIFTNSGEVSLWRIINQAGETAYLRNKQTYINKIVEIKEKLNPFRNIDRSHNIPWRKGGDKKIPISDIKKWLSFAETIYKEIVEKIGLSFPINGLVPAEFDEQIKRNIKYYYQNYRRDNQKDSNYLSR